MLRKVVRFQYRLEWSREDSLGKVCMACKGLSWQSRLQFPSSLALFDLYVPSLDWPCSQVS